MLDLKLNDKKQKVETIKTGTRVKAVAAGAIGNVLEWFDYGVYGTLAAIISDVFFPNKDPLTSLLYTFAVFGVGFLIRPVGSIVFGHIGDKYGRKRALSLTILIMSVSTCLIGLIPSFTTIGIMAPFLLTLTRLLQGISAGGEWGGSVSFIVEYANEKRRGFYGSWQQVSLGGGFMLGSLIGIILINSLTKDQLYSWGWRLPFIIGSILLGVVGWYMRSQLEDTPVYKKAEERQTVIKNPILTAVRSNFKGMVQAIGFTMVWTGSFYILLTFMPNYINRVLKLPLSQSLLVNFFSYFVLIILEPIAGHLSDKIGRKPILVTACVGFAFLTYPLFILIRNGNFLNLVLAQLVLGFFLAIYSGAGVAFNAEIFPTNVRYSTLSIAYNIANPLFGGMAPFIATYMVAVTGNNIAPAFYVVVAAIVSLVAILTLPDRYDQPLK